MSSSSTTTNNSPAVPDTRMKKSVSFNTIEIIEMPYIVGDGPATGVPISIGWEAQSRNVFNIDFFEQYRPQRRSKQYLRLSDGWREQLLLRNGYSIEEMSAASYQAYLTRKERNITIQQLCTLRQLKIVQRSMRVTKKKLFDIIKPTKGPAHPKALIVPARTA